jgi:hypothetical protein
MLDMVGGSGNFVNEELNPQLGDLVLDDEEHLIVMGRGGQGLLLGQKCR